MPFTSPPPFFTPIMLEEEGEKIFNPVWVKWLTDFQKFVNGLSVGTTVILTVPQVVPPGTNVFMEFTDGRLTDSGTI